MRTLNSALFLSFFVALLGAGCGEELSDTLDGADHADGAAELDAGAERGDASGPELPSTDAGAVDAGATDAGVRDAGRADAGRADAGRADAGRADLGTDPNAPADMLPLLAIMNEARAETNSAPLTWHAGLADTALSWAMNCTWEHAPQATRTYQGQVLGENLSAGSGTSWSPVALGQGWNDEKSDYNCPNNTCAPGAVCGHYTQVIWRNSTQVGCAIHTCASGSPFGNGSWRFLVCRYLPAGNFGSQRPIPVGDCP